MTQVHWNFEVCPDGSVMITDDESDVVALLPPDIQDLIDVMAIGANLLRMNEDNVRDDVLPFEDNAHMIAYNEWKRAIA